MEHRLTFHIEDFGRIKSADIELSPLMLFVGENNSGKSYVMSLLWGVITLLPEYVYKSNIESMESFKAFEKWLLDYLDDEEIEVEFNNDGLDLLIEFCNDLLEINKEKIVGKIFNYSHSIGTIRIKSMQLQVPISLNIVRNSITIEHGGTHRHYQLGLLEDRKLLPAVIERIIECLVNHSLIGEPLYLPSSRTGFMLSYKTLMYSLIGTSFSANSEDLAYKSTFSLPVIRFLQRLVQIEFDENSLYSKFANQLESEAIKGKVIKRVDPSPHYSYKPIGCENDLPLHVTSSLVTELMPLIIFLKSNHRYKHLIIEEPEAHLHLEVQTTVAKALVRLVNQGLFVWLTTHSDTIFQQFNNMIKLHNHPNRDKLARELGVTKEEFLNPEDVTAYQFNVAEDGTTVIKHLKLGNGGFVVPTFNEAIVRLSKETLHLGEFD